MIEIAGDIWQEVRAADVLVVPTNGQVKKDGRAVMGAGFALAVRERWPGTDLILGSALEEYGNHVNLMGVVENGSGVLTIVSFPTKDHWKHPSDMDLIRRSAGELGARGNLLHLGWKRVLLPRVGCGRGGLSWNVVKPLLKELDDRFVVVHPEDV